MPSLSPSSQLSLHPLSVETERPHHLAVPPSRPLRVDTTLSPASPFSDSSPALSMKIKVPKRQYSIDDPLQRMETPMFDKRVQRAQKKGPSSPATVLTMAGLFVVGVLLMISGLIVLVVQRQMAFVITGAVFMGIGFSMLVVCAIMQRKNVVKFIKDLNRDLYFLNMSQSNLWKFMMND